MLLKSGSSEGCNSKSVEPCVVLANKSLAPIVITKFVEPPITELATVIVLPTVCPAPEPVISTFVTALPATVTAIVPVPDPVKPGVVPTVPVYVPFVAPDDIVVLVVKPSLAIAKPSAT